MKQVLKKIRTKSHQLGIYEVFIISLSFFDDKRIILTDVHKNINQQFLLIHKTVRNSWSNQFSCFD